MYLEIENLSKSFDGKEVVSGLKLSMNRGEILCLLGASGCGKKQEPLREGERSYQIYYLNPSATRMVTREYRTMTVDSDTLVQELLDALMNVPADLDAQVPISEKVACQGARQEGMVLYLFFDNNYTSMSPGREILCRAALTKTLTQVDGIDYISIYSGEQPLLDNGVFRIEVLEIVVYAHIDQMPVIQPGAAHGPLGDIEAQRPDEMQHGAGCGAGAGNIAGVLRDLRRNKDNVQHGAPAEKRFSRQHALQNTADQYSMTNDPKIQLFFLNFQKNSRQNPLVLDSVKGETGEKVCIFQCTVEMKQPYTMTEPNVKIKYQSFTVAHP